MTRAIVVGLFMYALALALSACGGPAPTSICENPYGLIITDLPKGWYCSDIVRTQTILQAELQKTRGDKRLKGFKDLSHFEVIVHDSPSWIITAPDGTFDVMGVTYCHSGEIHIGNSPPQDNALPHEMVHALQNCDPMYVPNSVNDRAHEGWEEQGIDDALHETWVELAPMTLEDGGTP